MLYLATPPAHADGLAAYRRHNIGVMSTPNMANIVSADWPYWAADNGCFGGTWNRAKWFAWLEVQPRERCLFATAPDVVGDAKATLARAYWLKVLHEMGYPAAFVAQDGLQAGEVPWADLDWLFIGGTTAWKTSDDAATLMKEAKARGKMVHVGRVNSYRRLRWCAIHGADSADGTYTKYGPDINVPKMTRWVTRVRAEQAKERGREKRRKKMEAKTIEARSHPAKFNDAVLDVIARYVRSGVVLDPFAGVGKIFELEARRPVECWAVELEAEWARQSFRPARTYIGDAFEYMAEPTWVERFDAVVTSPTYGNRMADHHDARDSSKRYTYKHTLGRDLSPNNSGALQWGHEYREFHRRAWLLVWRVLKPGGKFVVNVKDHPRGRMLQGVPAWHRVAIKARGFKLMAEVQVPVKGMGHGENQADDSTKADVEWVMVFKKMELAESMQQQLGALVP